MLALAIVLAACGATGAPQSGINGTILAGPACPGPARAESPCPDRPATMTIEVLSGTSVVATVMSDPAGSFSVSLPPGTYVLRSKDGSPILEPTTVVVAPDRYTALELHADTGVR